MCGRREASVRDVDDPLDPGHRGHGAPVYRTALGLDEVLTPHALRHSYVTHLIESGVDPAFVQRQVGHLHQSTTAIYTGVSADYMNTMMSQAIEKTRHRPRDEEESGR